jgi:hypothetical protein
MPAAGAALPGEPRRSESQARARLRSPPLREHERGERHRDAERDLFPASDRAGQSPVPMSVQVAVGETSYAFPFGTSVEFAKLRSSQMDLTLPTKGGRFTLPKPSALDGAVYRGLVIGVSGPGGVVKPVQVRWPDARGNFSILVPRSLRGKALSFWQNHRIAFQGRAAAPGALVDLRTWPASLPPRVPSGLARITLP